MKFGKKRLGNWVVTKYNKKGVPFIKIKPVSGEFSWEYSSLDAMFVTVESAVDDELTHDGLQICLSIMGSFIHAADPVFYDLYVKCLQEYARIAEVRKPTSQEEERDIIEEMRVRYEINEELKKTGQDIIVEKIKNGDIKLDNEEIKLPESDNKEELSGEGWSVKAGENFDLKV